MTIATASHAVTLTAAQFRRSLLVGVVLWFIAAMILRLVGPMGAFEGNARYLTYALVILGTWPFALAMPWMAGVSRAQMVPSVGAATLAASLLDAVALAWVPQLYGSRIEIVAGAGATILWGVGVGLAMAFYLGARPAR